MKKCQSYSRKQSGAIFMAHRVYILDLLVYRCFVVSVHPRIRRGNIFCRVCLCVCPVRAITFESLDLETSFLVCRYIFRI